MIIITGASRGIGKFLFEKYLLNGEEVFGTYKSTHPNENIDKYFQVDVSVNSQIQSFIEKISNKLKQITLLNCAGTNYNSYAHKADLSKWSEVINVNLIGTFTFIKAILPLMRKQNFGRIINFSSVVAQKGIPGTSAYSASKSALWGLTKSIAAENATKGITINNLNLGYFNIGMITDVPENYQEIIKQQIPTHKFGDPNEIYNAIEFLRHNSYINGTSIDINAGLV